MFFRNIQNFFLVNTLPLFMGGGGGEGVTWQNGDRGGELFGSFHYKMDSVDYLSVSLIKFEKKSKLVTKLQVRC